VQHNAPNVNQVTVSNFVMAGGNLGAIGCQDGVGSRRHGNADTQVERFNGRGGSKAEAIAPGLLLLNQRILVTMRLS
jgi:hypothetical protein